MSSLIILSILSIFASYFFSFSSHLSLYLSYSYLPVLSVFFTFRGLLSSSFYLNLAIFDSISLFFSVSESICSFLSSIYIRSEESCFSNCFCWSAFRWNSSNDFSSFFISYCLATNYWFRRSFYCSKLSIFVRSAVEFSIFLLLSFISMLILS